MKNEKYIVDKNDSIENVISKILINNHRTVFVIDKKKIIGTISEGDVLRSLLIKKNLKSPANKIMNKAFKYIFLNKNLKKAKNIFQNFHVSIIPVLNKKFELKEVITLKDILR